MSFPATRALRVAFAITLAAGIASCARLRVESDPVGAKVLWSPDGTTDWRPWPPKAWDTSAGKDDLQTPMTSYGRYSDAIWVTVEKDGYYRPRPQIAQLYSLRNQKLRFELLETPDTVAMQRRAAGFVPYEGAWVLPAEFDLVEYDAQWMPRDRAFELEQRAKGLVPYEGEWLTAEQFESRFAADQRAKGLVPFKNRWVAPEVVAAEEAIDAGVSQLATLDLPDLDLPKVLGRVDSTEARVQLFNTTSRTIRFLISGPMSREYTLEPYDSYGVTPATRLFIPAGRYQVAVIPLDSSPFDELETEGIGREVLEDTRAAFPSMYLETPLAAGFHYLFGYTGGADVSLEEGGEYRIQTPELPPDLPSIVIPEVQLPEPRRPQRPNGPGGQMGPGGGPGGGRQGMPGAMPPGAAPGGQRPQGGQQGGQQSPAPTPAPAPVS